MSDQNNNTTQSNDEELDILWIVPYLWSKKKIIIYATLISFILAMVAFVLSPRKYTCQASILPITGESSVSSGMSLLASMAGVGMKSTSSSNIITPSLYPAVSETTPFLKKLMHVPLKWADNDTIMSTYEYAERMDRPLSEIIYSYTIGLPTTIMNAVKPQKAVKLDDLEVAGGDKEKEYLVLNKAERRAIKILKDLIVIEEDAKISAINISSVCENREQAVILTSAALGILQETIIEFKTKRSSQTLGFLEERYAESSKEYEKIRKQYYDYKDSHRNMIDERIDIEYQQLSDQYQMSHQILKTLASQLEEAKLEIMEETPVFSVLQPAVLPYEKSHPKVIIYLAVGILLGGFASIAWYLVPVMYFSLFKEKKYYAIKAQYDIKEE